MEIKRKIYQTNEVINLIEKDDSYYNSKLEKIKYNDEHLINDQMKIRTKPYPLMEYLFKENDDKYNEMDNHINDIDDDDDDNINNLCDEKNFRKYHIKSNMNNNQNILNMSNSYNQTKVSNISKRYSIEKNTNTMKNRLDNMSYISSFNNIKNEDILNVHNDQLSFDTIKLNNSRNDYHENNLINIKNCDSISRDILNNEENEIISDKYSDKLMTYKNYDSQNEYLKEEKYNENQKTKTKLNTINKTKELNLYTLNTHHDDQQINNLRKDPPTDANTNANISMNIENVSKTNKETYIKKNIHMIHKSNNNVSNATPNITNPTNSKMNNIVKKKKKNTQQINTLQTKKTNKNTVLKIKGGEEKQKKIIQTKNITSKVLNKNIANKGETVLVPSKKKEKLMNNSEKKDKEENCSNKENRLINQKIMNTSINFDDTQNLSDEDKFIFDSYLNEENIKKESLQEIISNQVRQFEQIFL